MSIWNKLLSKHSIGMTLTQIDVMTVLCLLACELRIAHLLIRPEHYHPITNRVFEE